MSIHKKEALAQFHRANIIRAAEKLFLENGFEGTTMDHIAKAADYSKATIYVYIKNKEEIISEITLISMRLFCENMKQAISISPDFTKQYYALCHTMVQFQRDYPLYYESLLKEINVDLDLPETPKVYHEIFKAGEEINQVISSVLRQGIDQGQVRNDISIIEISFIFWAGISGIINLSHKKEKYLAKYHHITREAFLSYSFETLLKSITIS